MLPAPPVATIGFPAVPASSVSFGLGAIFGKVAEDLFTELGKLQSGDAIGVDAHDR